jgi:UDP-3-O-[3-hydroxymyristoyl] glucosamine N-acyltransferase
VGGQPVVDKGTYIRTLTIMPKLPDMYKRLMRLEKELAELKNEAEK